MSIIIPIGGGDIKNKTTEKIDKYILSLIKKDIKNVLFIPTASGDNKEYISTFKQYYESLDCKVDVLALSYMQNDNMIRSLIFSADIIYIGGGNTSRMLRVWKRHNIATYLNAALSKGIILTGLSAGCACFFNKIYSDSNRSTNINNPLSFISGLNFINATCCPHYNNDERKSFDDVISSNEIGVAIEDDVALIYENGNISKVIKANDDNKAYQFINKCRKEIIND